MRMNERPPVISLFLMVYFLSLTKAFNTVIIPVLLKVIEGNFKVLRGINNENISRIYN